MSTEHFPSTTAEYNAALDRRLSRIAHMNLKRWKIIKSTLLSMAVLGFAAYSIFEGADPTTVAVPALIISALIAGVEWSELLAVWAEGAVSIHEQNDNE